MQYLDSAEKNQNRFENFFHCFELFRLLSVLYIVRDTSVCSLEKSTILRCCTISNITNITIFQTHCDTFIVENNDPVHIVPLQVHIKEFDYNAATCIDC